MAKDKQGNTEGDLVQPSRVAMSREEFRRELVRHGLKALDEAAKEAAERQAKRKALQNCEPL